MKYDCFAVEGGGDLQILFHCRRQFPKYEADVRQAAFPSFDFNLQAKAAAGAHNLGDSHSFGEFVVAMAATPQLVSPKV
ncbi:hypothetical protein PIB30_026464 [Stylosanthes scabra]|uniref:Uncharacterized protein n=1 Tax=Stylosanthes scabra TaxID=79078 RepID=A0ABU6VBV5_9FABA|nr:hypothetical protein [Stylosanthes scabra]